MVFAAAGLVQKAVFSYFMLLLTNGQVVALEVVSSQPVKRKGSGIIISTLQAQHLDFEQ
jgi:hypothetical protein